MRGTILIIRTREPAVEARPVDGAPQLDALKAGLEGGYLEVVPFFQRIEYDGEVHRCVAFCDEEGSRKELPYNGIATALWHAQTQDPWLRRDHIKGNIVIVFGDREFMEAL